VELNEKQFITGFNSGYILAKYEPQMLTALLKDIRPINSYVQGISSGQIKEDKWISPEEAMTKLRIKSKTTLQKLRDEGKIRFSQPEKKIILYDSESIKEYLEKHSNDTY